MKLPGKIIPYRNSVLALFPVILREVRDGQLTVAELFTNMVTDEHIDSADFLSALDALYALRKIDLTEEGFLYYVD